MNLFVAKAKNFLRALVRRDFISIMKFVVGIIVVLLFAVGAYGLFYAIFNYLKDVQDIGPLIADRTVSIGFLAFFLMLFISNAIGSITTIFRSSETEFLLTKPQPYTSVFSARFTDNLFYSSWATLIVGIPLILAYGRVYKIKAIFMPVLVSFGILPFVALPAYMGSALTILLFLVTKRVGFRKALTFFVLLCGVVVIFFVREGGAPALIMNIRGDIRLLNYYLQNLATASNPYLPNVWFLELLRSAKANSWGDVLFWASLLTSTALAFWVFLLIFARKYYFTAYLSSAESLGRKTKLTFNDPTKGLLWKILLGLPQDMKAIIIKDFRLFVRDSGQWGQFTLLVSLLLLYLVNLRLVPMNIRNEFWQTVISFTNFAFCGYILATLSVRFVFPSISMEGRSMWRILTSPMAVERMFWAKFMSAFAVFFTIAEIVAVVSNGMLAQSGFMMVLTASGILLMSVSLTSLSVGLGAIFPSFDSQNPARIASGGGGMIAALLSLAYVGLMVVLLALPAYKYSLYLIGQTGYPKTEIISSFLLVILLNILASYLPLKLGIRAIKRKDF